MTDRQLLSRFQSGDTEALCQLITRHMPMVYATARREVRDPHMADDITQAVFLVLMRRAKSIPASAVLAGWLFKTTLYAAADARKMQNRRTYHEREAATMRFGNPSSTPENGGPAPRPTKHWPNSPPSMRSSRAPTKSAC